MLKGQINDFIKKIKTKFKLINKKINENDESKIKTLKTIFIELKNNLVISNMILVFGIITLAFIFIFVFMKQMLLSDSQATMKSIIYRYTINNEINNQQLISEVSREDGSDGMQNQSGEDEAGYIYLTYSTWNDIITYNNSRYTLKSEELKKAFQTLVTKELQGKTSWNNITYRYLINKNSFPAGTYKIVFYNLSSENRFLKLLAIGLVFLDIILSVISYYISLFITGRSINPIRETIERQKQFTEDASHELRTPLTVLQTNIEVLKSEPDLTIKEQEKWIGYIDDEIKRMSKLVSELLTLSRLDNNKHNEEYEEMNLTEELFKIIEAYSKFVKNKNLELLSDIDKNVIFTCQPNKIKQLINIFLDNAIKYNNPGGYIKLSLNKKKSTFELIVEDSGKGISKEDQKKIFNRFYRGDSSRSTEGTGLGLSIAQSIVDKHNGTIKIESDGNKGTKFIIEFPYYS